MERDIIEGMLASLPIARRRRAVIERELRGHLEESRHELEAAGWDPDVAQRESVARLGDPTEIANEFRRVYRPNGRTRLGLAFGLAAALLLGVYGGGTLASATSAHKNAHPVKVTNVSHAPTCHHALR